MTHLLRRAGIVAGAATATIALTASAGFAHECYIANQSTKAQSGLKSQVWFKIDLIAEMTAGGGWSSEEAECVASAATAAGLPLTVNIMGKTPPSQDGVLGSKNPNSALKAGDGKGIDHFFSGSALTSYLMIIDDCGAGFPFPEE